MPFHNLEPINTKQRNRSRVIRPPEEDGVANVLAFQEIEYFRRLSVWDLLRLDELGFADDYVELCSKLLSAN